jgi:hypothetical protein
MPIVGVPQSTLTAGNVSEWSHSTVFTKYQSTYQAQDVPALTTFWKAPTGCSNRWMAVSVTVLSNTTLEALPVLTETISTTLTGTPTPIGTNAALLPRVVPAPTTSRSFALVSETHTSSRVDLLSSLFVAVSTNPGNPNSGALYDPSYTSCQPYSSQYHYSPGICPYGKTVAEITEYHYVVSSGSTVTRFEASCCER